MQRIGIAATSVRSDRARAAGGVSAYTDPRPRIHCPKGNRPLTDAPIEDSAAEARTLLATAHSELVMASKVAVGNDGKTLLGAAAAAELAAECLMPPNADTATAESSCREALGLAKETRSYAQGGTIANLLDPAKEKLERALEILSA